MRIPNIKSITGDKTKKIGDVPEKVGKIRKSRIINPYRFRKTSASAASRAGSSPINILPPSNGWMGTRLKIAKTTLSMMIGYMNKDKVKDAKGATADNLNIIESTKARSRLEAGPAREMSAESRLGFFRL